MKIKKISYENFRNFKDKGSLTFDTEKGINIIYGPNGAGKTTLHQLFKWIIYGNVHFNRESNDKIWNTTRESELAPGESMLTIGKLEFEHDGEIYAINRETEFIKEINSCRENKKTFTITKKTKTKDWTQIANPDRFIEEILPSGLSDYFFFDGERMISSLNTNSKESALKLKDAIYLMLNLSIYQKAADCIGDIDHKSTVLGTLFFDKPELQNNPLLANKYKNAQEKRDYFSKLRDDKTEAIKRNEQEIVKISETIGSSKSTAEYEKERNTAKEEENMYHNLVMEQYANFGEEIAATLPRIFVASASKKAADLIDQEYKKSKLLPGTNKELIDQMLKNKTCICGRPLGKDEVEILNGMLDQLPPRSYDFLYVSFLSRVKSFGKLFNKDALNDFIDKAKEWTDKEDAAQEKITEIDRLIRENSAFADLANDRNALKAANDKLNLEKEQAISDLRTADIYLKSLEKELEKNKSLSELNNVVERKIAIMTAVKEYFSNQLQDKTKTYSLKMQNSIQELLDKMLLTKRTVKVDENFQFIVYDNFADQSKSEGQFAVVCFAYIGGVFKMLKSDKLLSSKEFPLILDAPFSKLGDEPRKNVITYLPEYAPQIILFSKDDLGKDFGDKIGKQFYIKTNKAQNIAEIKEGDFSCLSK